MGDRLRPGRPRRGRVGPEPPADGLVCHRAAGGGRCDGERPGWRRHRGSAGHPASSWRGGSVRSGRPNRWRSWSTSWVPGRRRALALRTYLSWPGSRRVCRPPRQVAMPAEWPRVFAGLAADPDAQVRSRRDGGWQLTFGDPKAQGGGSHRRPGRSPGRASSRVAKRSRPCSRSKDPTLTGTAECADRRPGASAARRCAACPPMTTPRRRESY